MSGPRSAIVLLERRYGRAGDEVLERLRAAKTASGQLDEAAVAAVADELELPRSHIYGAASFFADLGLRPRGARHIRVCAGTACLAASAGTHVDELGERLGVAAGEVSRDGELSLEPVYCLGYCYGGPAALDGEQPHAGPDLVEQLAGDAPRRDPDIPAESSVEDPVLLSGLEGSGPEPWSGWREVLAAGARERVVDEVSKAGLRGRGGGGFPAAHKWQAAADAASDGPRYLICNGDEGDPGSYADRLLMERDPQRVLEGVALAALASEATKAYVYVRSEYPRARDEIGQAVEQARRDGHLGPDVRGSGIDLEIEVFEGAGSYVAGEETSLIHSMEGLRGAVAARPPFPTEHGLLDRPTTVNNAETLAAVPWIVSRGGEAYASLGTGDSRGTKLACLNERFRRPGVYEVELGTSIRSICDELGGGLRDGHELRALQVGGPLGGFLTPDRLDTPLTFADLAAAGAALGHGSLIAVDERISGRRLLAHMWRFAASESCGTCSACRIGTRRGLELAERVEAAGPAGGELELMDKLLDAVGSGSLCAFGTALPGSVRGILRAYADELSAEGA